MYSAELTRNNRFWKVEVAADHTVAVSYGAIGSMGRTTTNKFDNADDAENAAKEKAEKKLNEGYTDAASSGAEPVPMEEETEAGNTTKRSSKRSSKRTKAETEDEEEKTTSRSTRRNSKRVKTEPEVEQQEEKENIENEADVKPLVSSKKKSKGKSKKAKAEPKVEPQDADEEEEDEKSTDQLLGNVVIPVDEFFHLKKTTHVVADFDATLNQTNITGGNNNNKYYRIQLLQTNNNKQYYVWTRWGRVGEVNKSSSADFGPFSDFNKAKAVFEKKFKDKTGNKWENRANFVPKNKKYDLLEVDYTKDPDAHLKSPGRPSPPKKEVNIEYEPCQLDDETKDLVDMLFEKSMYEHAMLEFDFDTRRMPLGQLSSAQVQRGVDVLMEIEEIFRSGMSHARLPQLSSRFYSVLPHDFGRRRPPIINTPDMLQQCFDKCNILLDIEKANSLMEAAEQKEEAKVEKQILPHPTDAIYKTLGADLSLVDKQSAEYRRVFNAFVTTGDATHTKLVNVWRVNRHGEDGRFAPYAEIGNKKCLWHGTNIAVVAAILSSGLRIMPHSGGRVGKGIYLASECGKSQGYTSPSPSRKTACMFLAEAALGKEFDLLHDDSSLKKAPNGFDSVVARGNQTPAKTEPIEIDGHQVLLPTGKPKRMKKYESSSFFQDEYLVYREEQVRLRYVLTVDYGADAYW